jgi:UDPglucose 6-dehydrogenase
MRLAMIGTGYVGLVSGACFSEFGVDVVCVDKDADKIARLQAGEVPIYEPGLPELLASNAKAGRLTFSTDLGAAVADADLVFIAVGTPSRRGDGHADLSYVYAAAREIALALNGSCVVVTKSTVPVGTSREVARILREARPDLQIGVASNPEFLREGSAIEDFMRPDRVVIGTEDEGARTLLARLYRPLSLNDRPFVFTTPESAELIKYATNSFLATKVTFINQIADLCEKVGANVQDVARGLGCDGRIGAKFLHPGPGYGGSCFPKDTLALVRSAQQAGAPVSIVEAVVKANTERKEGMAGRIIRHCGGSVDGKMIAVLGLTFKPNTDDVRDAPSLTILPELLEAGARLRVYDPEGMEAAQSHLPDVRMCESPYHAMAGAVALVVLTEWNEFRALDLDRTRRLLKTPLIIDLRNIYALEEMKSAGFTYHSVGRPSVLAEV